MAIELQKKMVVDDIEYNDYAIGITLPIQIKNTAFNQSFTSIEQIKSNLINLLSTRKGERILQPNFGCDLHSILFNNITDTLETDIEGTIDEAIEQWLPMVTVEEVLVDRSDMNIDRNYVGVSIKFSVSDFSSSEVITFNIEE
jgi:phage baseplate assembly protein W